MHIPTMECYNAALDLLLYVHSIKDLKLNFPGKCEIPKGSDPSMHSKAVVAAPPFLAEPWSSARRKP